MSIVQLIKEIYETTNMETIPPQQIVELIRQDILNSNFLDNNANYEKLENAVNALQTIKLIVDGETDNDVAQDVSIVISNCGVAL